MGRAGLIRVQEVDPEKLPRYGALNAGEPRQPVTVAYTTAVRKAVGGEKVLHNLIELAAAEANLPVAYEQELDLIESGNLADDLLRFEEARENLLPKLHQDGAVNLWVDRGDRCEAGGAVRQACATGGRAMAQGLGRPDTTRRAHAAH